MKVETCIAKVGQPDIENGMRTCRRPCFYAVAGDIVNGQPAIYTGWRHVYDEDLDHGAVNESWV